MIRIAIIAIIAYCSIGYAVENPGQASMLHKSASSVVSVVYEKAKSLFGDLKEDNKQATTMPTQKVSVYL
jgi:hypothetical protein